MSLNFLSQISWQFHVFGQFIASQGKMWIGLLVNSIWALSLLILSYFLVVKYNKGAMGLTLSYLFSYIVHSITQITVYRKMKIRC